VSWEPIMKWFSSILLIAAIVIPVMAADTAKPNLSGKWVLNEKESDLPKPPAMREGCLRGANGRSDSRSSRTAMR
jgi:hypothetical protein